MITAKNQYYLTASIPPSYILERIAQCRLQLFLDSNDLMPETQSAYRRFHRTETAVTKVYNDLLFSALCLLDLTAASILWTMLC